MSSPIDNCLEKHWNNIVQALSPEQKQAIFGDLHCEDQEQAFNNIILKGNVGFHKFMKKLVEKVINFVELLCRRSTSRAIIITSFQVALPRRQQKDHVVFEPICHLPTYLPHLMKASHCPF